MSHLPHLDSCSLPNSCYILSSSQIYDLFNFIVAYTYKHTLVNIVSVDYIYIGLGVITGAR